MDGPPVVPHYYISDTNSEPEVLNVDNLLAAAGVQEAFYGHQEFTVNTVQNRGLVVEKCAPEGQLDEDLMAGDGFADFSVPVKEEIQIASSDSEVEIVGVQEDPRRPQSRLGVIQSCSTWNATSHPYCLSAREQPPPQQQIHSWAAVTQPPWTVPPEVVDLTCDEDARRRYLL